MEKRLVLNVMFNFGDTVYRKVNDEPYPGMVLGYSVRPSGNILYYVSWAGGEENMHYDIELTSEKPADFDVGGE